VSLSQWIASEESVAPLTRASVKVGIAGGAGAESPGRDRRQVHDSHPGRGLGESFDELVFVDTTTAARKKPGRYEGRPLRR